MSKELIKPIFRLNDNKVEEQMQQKDEMCYQKENQYREQIKVINEKIKNIYF
jgi:hypothetical protein